MTPLLQKYGAAIVVGTIDEDGMAVSAERKIEIAKRSYELLTKKYGIRPSDIIFDALVFPVGTGDEEYIGSAAATIEGIRLIKEALPECLTILGVSNISFGLPPAGREVLNSVFIPCYESRIRLRDCEYGKIRTLCVNSRGRKTPCRCITV